MNIGKNILLFVALVLAIFGGISGAQANLITNGDFEAGTSAPTGHFRTLFASPDATADDITGWLVTSGSIDWINSYWAPHSETRALTCLAGPLAR
jgi:hypothetical protein